MNIFQKYKNKSNTTLYYNNMRKSSTYHPYFHIVKPFKAKLKIAKSIEKFDIINLDFLFNLLKINQ